MDAAVRAIKSGDKIWCGETVSISYDFLDKLNEQRKKLRDVTILYNLSTSMLDMLFDEESKKHFRLISMFTGPLIACQVAWVFRNPNVVPWLRKKCVVTTPRYLNMYIVSEYVVADVFLRANKDRISRLLKIAHPDYREELKGRIISTGQIATDEFYD